jgi:hypothetical protein
MARRKTSKNCVHKTKASLVEFGNKSQQPTKAQTRIGQDYQSRHGQTKSKSWSQQNVMTTGGCFSFRVKGTDTGLLYERGWILQHAPIHDNVPIQSIQRIDTIKHANKQTNKQTNKQGKDKSVRIRQYHSFPYNRPTNQPTSKALTSVAILKSLPILWPDSSVPSFDTPINREERYSSNISRHWPNVGIVWGPFSTDPPYA